MFERHRPQQHGVDHAKDCSVGTDTQRERDNSYRRERWILRSMRSAYRISWPRSENILIVEPFPEVIGSCETRRSTFFSSRRNRSVVFNSSTIFLRASSSDAQLLSARSYSCSRCCESSSTISASLAGDNWSSDSRALISALKSGMLNPGDQVDGFDELAPASALLR